MPRFRSRPTEISAWQFKKGDHLPLGVCISNPQKNCPVEPHVHTMHDNQPVVLAEGDWVVPEPDGVHYYPIKDEVFRQKYERVP